MKLPKHFLDAAALGSSLTDINDQEYVYTIIIYNSDGEYMTLYNTKVRSLVISDDLASPFCSAVLVVDNRLDLMGNYHKTKLIPKTETSKPESFKFKNDGLDLVLIKIKPKFSSKEAPPSIDDKIFPEKIWDLSYVFSVYEEDEFHDANTPDRKWKTLYLREFKEQILSQSNISWSTATMDEKHHGVANSLVTQVSDRSRSVLPGACIKDIIKTAFKEIKMFGGNISNTFDKQWEEGAAPIFYSSPANARPMDDIEYILDCTVSADTFDNCILKYERDRVWSLRPMSKYFDRVFTPGTRKPGDFVIDFLPMAGDAGPEAPGSMVFNKSKINGMTRLSFDINIQPDEMAGIKNWSFFNMSTDDSTNLLTSCVVGGYHGGKGQFFLEYADHHIDKIKEKCCELYVDKMHGENKRPGCLLPIDDFKRSNALIDHVWVGEAGSRSAKIRKKAGVNKVLSKFINNNIGLNFKMAGLTYRKAGRFVTLVNTLEVPNVPHQDMLQGEWLITNITHEFTGSRYTNNITCVKPYAYRDIYKKK